MLKSLQELENINARDPHCKKKSGKDPFKWRAAPLFPSSCSLLPMEVSLIVQGLFPKKLGNFP